MGALATMETNAETKEKVCALLVSHLLAIFLACNGYSHPTLSVTDLHLHTICALQGLTPPADFVSAQSRTPQTDSSLTKPTDTVGLFQVMSMEDGQKVKPWVNFHSNVIDLCIFTDIRFLTYRQQSPVTENIATTEHKLTWLQ